MTATKTRIAGRALDAEIATRVIGWTVEEWPCGYQPDACDLECWPWEGDEEREGSSDEEFQRREAFWRDNIAAYPERHPTYRRKLENGNRPRTVVPFYSTDIGAAWMVVEKAIADGWFPEVQFNNWGAESWYATMSRTTDDPLGGYASGVAATAPLAICRAALKAIASLPSRVVQETDT